MKNTPWYTISYWWSQMLQQNEEFIWAAYFRISLPWFKKILDFDDLKFPRIKALNHLSQHIFIMVDENFVFWWSQMPQQNEGFIWTTYLRIFSPWMIKILDFDDLKFPRMKDSNLSSKNIFTMVEEKFEFWWSEIPKNEGFEPLVSAYLHHGWR